MEKVRKFSERNFGVASFKYNRWSLDLEENQTIEHALDPSNWAHLASRIMGSDKANPKGRGDIVEVRKIETGLYAELIVTEVSQSHVRVRLLRNQEAEAKPVPEESPLKPRWNPGRKMHEVVRVADNAVMQSGFQTRDLAVNWISDHLSKIAA